MQDLHQALFSARIAPLTTTLITYAIFVLLRAISQLAVDREKVARLEAEVRRWEERRRKAIEAKDAKLFERVQKERSRVDRLRREIEVERLKGALAASVAWILLSALLLQSVGDVTAVRIPVPWDYYLEIPFSAWFLLNSLWAATLVDRLCSLLPLLASRAHRAAPEPAS